MFLQLMNDALDLFSVREKDTADNYWESHYFTKAGYVIISAGNCLPLLFIAVPLEQRMNFATIL